MRLVNLETFLMMPEGTVFSEYRDIGYNDLSFFEVKRYSPSDHCYFSGEAFVVDQKSIDNDAFFEGENIDDVRIARTERHNCIKSTGFNGDERFLIWDRESLEQAFGYLTSFLAAKRVVDGLKALADALTGKVGDSGFDAETITFTNGDGKQLTFTKTSDGFTTALKIAKFLDGGAT